MMKTITKKVLPVMIIVLFIGSGCKDGSPVVRLVQGIEIILFDGYGEDQERLDAWDTDGEEKVYGAAFGYLCRVQADGVPLAGIRVECNILAHHDPLDIGEDIWDRQAPNGERYGYVHPVPDGSWDRDDGVAVAYTDASGACVFLIGLGDPDVGFGAMPDNGYLWPSGSDGVSTAVEVQFIIRKLNGDIVSDCSMAFFRSQYQNFWEPYAGIFGNSFSALYPGVGWKSLDKNGDTTTTEVDFGPIGELELDEVGLVRKFPYPGLLDKSGLPSPDWIVVYDPNCIFIAGPLVPDPNCPYIVDPNCPWSNIVNPIPDANCPCYMRGPDCPDYPDPNCMIPDPNCMVPDPNCYILDPDWLWVPGPMIPDPNCYSYYDPNEIVPIIPNEDEPTSGEGWYFWGNAWMKWNPEYGWWYTNSMVATWISDIDDPAEVVLAMDLCQPYVFLCIFYIDDMYSTQNFQHTGVLISRNTSGQIVAQMAIKLYVYDISGNYVYLATNFILPMEFPEQQGEYYDRWGNSYAAIYVPDGGHLEVVKDGFYGDFDYNGYVDNRDYGMFAARWGKNVFGMYDPNYAYDLMYDADYDGQTDISDLIEFMDNWLEMR